MAVNETRLSNVELEDVQIRFRNFSGKPDDFNKMGKKQFQVVLDEADALAMQADGWNVKVGEPREEGDRPYYSIKVEVSDKVYLPRMVLITSRGRTNLDMQTCETLDYVDIEKVDVIINPSHWTVNGNSGIKAYLKSIYVTIKEDRFERKYAELGRDNAVDEWSR
ncbi:hypothetical protein SEA_GOCRAZY_65 [Arthrobacter phage GoCrazy]|uniref:Putative phage ssDNA-binding domain-containing protein n=1 Tax=Arthrobacter phage KeaneyLin TaxID=2250412 RepID=A0A345KMF0_9CAUD|nr:hypothetical protein PQB83_gp64 [Arthrobacter phage KeaneyLin]AXH44202.1 hypothetical protein SEA_KEANEYLIN_64 [Arthrobacter phage KeaneyLin]QXO13563.1 hypothetical protein SEA_GOCRAZY_65 [Arthrobacter phage GoCrazy]WBF79111.1 ssDNA binding protein [Arthrobacter phage Hankly]